MRRDAAEIEAAVDAARGQGLLEGCPQRRAPFAFEGEKPTQDRNERFGRVHAFCIWSRKARPVEAPDACHFFLCVGEAPANRRREFDNGSNSTLRRYHSHGRLCCGMVHV